MLERKFQADLISELRELFPGCYILKNDANYIQGFPDLLILFNNNWAAFEIKKGANAHVQPNQKWYVEHLDDMGFASFIYPENKEEVLERLNIYFMSD